MNYYEVGKIVNTHGIKGELKIISKTDFLKTDLSQETYYTLETMERLIVMKLKVIEPINNLK